MLGLLDARGILLVMLNPCYVARLANGGNSNESGVCVCMTLLAWFDCVF